MNNGISSYILSKVKKETKRLGNAIFIINIIFLAASVVFFGIRNLNYTNQLDNISLQIDTLKTNLKQTTDLKVIDTISSKINFYNYIGRNINGEKNENEKRTILFIIAMFAFTIMFYYYRKYKIRNVVFYCTNQECNKAIFTSSINQLVCPVCNIKSKSLLDLLNECEHCSTKLKYLECPHCKEPINLFEEYNHEEIKQKIYNS